MGILGERPPDIKEEEWVELDFKTRVRLKMDSFFRATFKKDHPDYYEPEQRDKLSKITDLVNQAVADYPELPDEAKELLDPLPVAMLGLLSMLGGMAGGMVASSILSPLLTPLTYKMNAVMKPYRLDPGTVFRLSYKLYKGEDISEELLGDLRDQGWSSDRIDKGLEAFKVMPTPSDIIAFLAHEVFEPDMVEKYKLLSEWEVIDKEFAKKIGMTEETLKLYWINHWVHPSLGSVYAMLHRDLITKEDVGEYYRLVETPEYWRDKLTELSWDMPNRIEIRMMARYLNLDKDFVKDMLKKAGLHEDYRDAGADFMLVMGLQGYWSTMYRNGWLTKEGLLEEIEAKELSPVIAERVYKYIVKAESPQRVEEHRKLTRALIIKGMKADKLDADETIALLMEHQNYDYLEAKYIVDVEIATMGSPESYLEFKKLVDEGKRAIGEEVKEIPAEVLEAGKTLAGLEASLKEKTKQKASQKVLNELKAEIALAKVRYEDLKALHEL